MKDNYEMRLRCGNNCSERSYIMACSRFSVGSMALK